MARIEEKFLQQLRDAKLFVSPPFAPTNAWPDGVWVGKPTSVDGNCIPDYRDGYIVIGGDRPLPPDMDAPMVVLCSQGDAWLVYSCDFAGGFMPSDFVNEWTSPDQAVTDILSFYFGDPKRMQAKARAKKRPRTGNEGNGDYMTNDRIPEPCITIMAISKQQGLIPTSAYARQARCYVHLTPLLWCSFNDPQELTQILNDIASKPVPEVAMSFEEVKSSSVVSSALASSKTISVSVEVLPETYHLRILRNNAKGEWLGEPCALEADFAPA
jgi:hypothetical protein